MNQWSLKYAGDCASRTWNQNVQLENAANGSKMKTSQMSDTDRRY